MRVKKFEAKTMKDALRMVKAELGPDAVILGAKENKNSFGLGGISSFEVTAAVSESTLKKKQFVEARLRDDDKMKFQSADARAQKAMIEKMVEKRLRNERAAEQPARASSIATPRPPTAISYIDIQDEPTAANRQQVYARRAGAPVLSQTVGGGIERAITEPSRPANPAATATAAPVDVRGKIRNLAREALEAGLPVVLKPEAKPAARAKTPSTVGESAMRERELETLRGEIHRLQALIDGFQKVPQTFQGSAHPGAEFGLGYDFSHSYQRLLDSGVERELAAEILTRASQEIDPMNAKKKAIVEAWVAKWFLQNISVCERALANRWHVFVGPTGGGKTSQLVKTAAQMVIREKKRVAIVSTDTSKVGAIDQLKIYCQILNVPFAIIRDRSEWAWLESQLHGVDHILVDAPGFALRDVDEIQKLRNLLPPALAASESGAVHLCLSSSMKESDALETVRRFRVANPTDLVFTGLDLSVNHGVVATVQLRSGLPLHSFGLGARVPEDFEVATKERVLDLLFKLSSLKR